jgi:signal transduction histidine kinase
MFIKFYRFFLNFILKNHLRIDRDHLFQVRHHLVIVLATIPLMWTQSYFYYKNELWAFLRLSVVFSLIHISTPLLFRIWRNINITINTTLFCLIFSQLIFIFKTQGFLSSHIILPLTLTFFGIILNFSTAIRWLVSVTMIISIFIILQKSGYYFPDFFSTTKSFWDELMIIYPTFLIPFTLIFFLNNLMKNDSNYWKNENKKIDDLFRVLFHDLVAPISRMSIGASITKKSLSEVHDFPGLKIMTQASDVMLKVTKSIRMIYSLSRGLESLKLSLHPVQEALNDVLLEFSAEINKKNILIKLNHEEFSHIHLLVEPIAFKEYVLGNILSNAIRFSPYGSEISVGLKKIHTQRFLLEIIDHGIGIPNHLVNDIFDITKKTARPDTEGEVGLGYGLKLTRAFVTAFNGDINIKPITPTDQGVVVQLILEGKKL